MNINCFCCLKTFLLLFKIKFLRLIHIVKCSEVHSCFYCVSEPYFIIASLQTQEPLGYPSGQRDHDLSRSVIYLKHTGWENLLSSV